MDTEAITSAQNPLIKRIRSIKTRKGRQRERAFWVEGLSHVLEAVQAAWEVECVVRAPDLLRSDEVIDCLNDLTVEERLVSADVFERISDRDGPVGLGAIVRTRDLSLGGLEVNGSSLIIVLIEPQDPGNLGTILRTAYCAGSSGVVLVGTSADLYDSRAVRASMGALFRLPVAREARVDGFIEWCKNQSISLIGTSARGTASYREVDYQLPAGIVMGNEQKGMPDEVKAACTQLVSIPMQGTLRSLNLSAATAVVLYEAAHRAGVLPAGQAGLTP